MTNTSDSTELFFGCIIDLLDDYKDAVIGCECASSGQVREAYDAETKALKALYAYVDGLLARIIAIEAQRDALIAACEEAASEIEYAHSDMLSQSARNHPRGSGWARVYDKLKAAIYAAEGVTL